MNNDPNEEISDFRRGVETGLEVAGYLTVLFVWLCGVVITSKVIYELILK